ncbi:TetR/AcrR family transcriptional regulator [Streptomyces sp. NPDC093225]|uniref:TetR/AcrR family transcriptional regulator n=1 Tax=Streptomyces sp. NPDC093225 TaxID=3366034 RepID=UPI003822B7FA
MSSPQRSTRSRPAKPPLSERAVVDAGLAVLREEGLGAVTMRRVAAALDTGPASLYVYVAGRDELLRLMFDAVVATVPLPGAPASVAGASVAGAADDGDDWREALAGTVADAVRALSAYPGLARVSLGHIPTSPAWLDLFDRVLGLLLAGGVERQRAAWGCDLIALYIGAASYEAEVPASGPADAGASDASSDAGASDGDGAGGTSGDGGAGGAAGHLQRALDHRHAAAGIDAALAALDPVRHPHLAATAQELRSGSAEDRLDLGVRVLIEGLAPRAAGPGAR